MQDRRMTLERRQAARRCISNGSVDSPVSLSVRETSKTVSSSLLPEGLQFEERQLPSDNEMWEVGHVARFLKRSESWVYKKSAAGVLPVHRLDGWGLRYLPIEIRNWAGETKKKHR